MALRESSAGEALSGEHQHGAAVMSFSGVAQAAALTDGVTGRRRAAWLVDAIIVGIAMTVLAVALWILGFITLGLGWFLLGGLWVLPIAYVFVFVASPGMATPGQALMGLAVVNDLDLSRPTPAQALVYAAAYAVTMWAGAIWLIAAFFTRRARCLHDIVAGLAVLRADAVPARSVWNVNGGSFGR
jgi:uncharacterized RDD family membrane protein YckC